MEENVALDSNKQKKFVKSLKGIKKLLKQNDQSDQLDQPNEVIKKRYKKRGLVYLAHIPHGFYEHEMTQYFKQFGVVTNVRVIRSKRTGCSKGFAFVEFKDPAVGEIVAETMNNYLMGKRLIKAAYIPPEKQRRFAKRKLWSRVNNPTRDLRIQLKKAFNANKDEDGNLQKAKKLLTKFNKTKKKLTAMGINYDFFKPVDYPEALLKVKKEDEKENATKVVTVTNNIKKAKGAIVKSEIKQDKPKKKESNKIKEESIAAAEAPNVKHSGKKDKKPEVNINKKEQKQKQQSLKDIGVSPPENFIKIEETSDGDTDSDSSYEFDSDAFENMIDQDDDIDSNASVDGSNESDDIDSNASVDGSNESNDIDSNASVDGSNQSDDNVSDDDDDLTEDEEHSETETDIESVEEIVPIKTKSKAQQPQIKKQVSKPEVKKSALGPKRKAPQKPAVAQKKAKFEKKINNKTNKKQFKKKERK